MPDTVERISSQELAEIWASAKTYADLNQVSESDYRRRANDLQAALSKTPHGAAYMFTVGPDVWDVFEILDEETVAELTSRGGDMKHAYGPRSDPSFAPIPPLVRYLLLVPDQPGSETSKALQQQFVDRVILVSVLLGPRDKYFPLSALYVGNAPTAEELTVYPEVIRRATIGLEKETTPAVPAPRFTPRLDEALTDFSKRTLSPTEQSVLVDLIVELDDVQFIEAVSFLVATSNKSGNASWVGPNPKLPPKGVAVMSRNPEWTQAPRNLAPWKTGGTVPFDYNPQMFLQLHQETKTVDIPVNF